ncbi:MAG: 50S ribosomal protein L29 [Simkaniaceae bacterium]|nr:50S ribosomal protein L29 [Simkaniaceae bacterium]
MLKMDELTGKEASELETQYHEITKEIFHLQNTLAIEKKLEKPHLLTELKKDRARVLTALNRKRS